MIIRHSSSEQLAMPGTYLPRYMRTLLSITITVMIIMISQHVVWLNFFFLAGDLYAYANGNKTHFFFSVWDSEMSTHVSESKRTLIYSVDFIQTQI